MNYGYFQDNNKINNMYPNLGQNVQNLYPNFQLNRNMGQNYVSPKKTNSHNFANSAFIEARIGKNLVISQDLNTFLNCIKTTEWATNESYLIAKDIDIRPTFLNKTKANSVTPRYSNKIDQLYLNVMNINQNDLVNYVNEVNTRKQKISENVKNERSEFIRNNFPNEGNKIELTTILSKIRENYEPFISKDQILYNKIINC